jgi:hypothetical protein
MRAVGIHRVERRKGNTLTHPHTHSTHKYQRRRRRSKIANADFN